MASANVKKLCATCKKGAGVATCDGCQQSFCSKHFVEHRQELSQQMDNIGQEHDLLQRDLDQHNTDSSLLSRINTWEQESIAKIQVAAEAARADLQELLDENKKELKKSVNKITDELQSCRESDDYTEIDINKWIQQLQALRKMLESPSTICIDENETPKSIIRLIMVRNQQQHRSSSLPSQSFQHYIPVVKDPSSSSNERFDEIVGKVNVSEEGLVVTGYAEKLLSPSIIYGANQYSSGTHRIHFRIEKIGKYRMLFGIITSSTVMKRTDDHDESLYGWRDLVGAVMNGVYQKSEGNKVVRTGDELILILDCDNRQIQLQHHRTNELVQLSIDIKNCPFPWKLVIKLPSTGDSVRILQ
jgi:hypothetical protein